MAKAHARHLLVADEATCLQLKEKIEGGADFGEIARQFSTCPSGQRGGDLGEFGRGAMVPEFDKACFEGVVGQVLRAGQDPIRLSPVGSG